jgi:hypothetical protein
MVQGPGIVAPLGRTYGPEVFPLLPQNIMVCPVEANSSCTMYVQKKKKKREREKKRKKKEKEKHK